MAATWYGDDSPHLSWKCAQVTGKAGENGHYSGEMGLRTHPSQDRRLPSVETHSTLWWATNVRSGVGIVFKTKTAPGSLSTGSRAGRTPPHGDGSKYSQANARAGKCAAAPFPSVAVRDRGH